MNTTQSKQKFQVYGTIQMPISIPVKAANEDEAMAIAQYQLYDFAVEQINLSLLKLDGDVIAPNTHGCCEINVEEVFED